MSWIKTIPFAEATGKLKQLYLRVMGPDNNVDNILQVHSLRVHTLTGHMALYKNVLHHRDNQFPKWYLESLGVYVSMLNQCDYCVDHHSNGLKRLLRNDTQHQAIYQALQSDQPEQYFAGKELLGFHYAKRLTEAPASIEEATILAMREAGMDDGEILEINQVASYFNYANRTVLGLGVNIEGDILGLSPNDNEDEENWGHS